MMQKKQYTTAFKAQVVQEALREDNRRGGLGLTLRPGGGRPRSASGARFRRAPAVTRLTRSAVGARERAMDRIELGRLLTAAFPDGEVEVTGDDGVHFEARIVTPAFAGKSLVEQHKLVYAALGDLMKETIHALSLKTYTPEAWARKR